MMRLRFAGAILALCALPQAVRPQAAENAAPRVRKAYAPVRAYDPGRNAARDLQAAIAEAKVTGKRILLVVGGQWCGWCRAMDRFFEENPLITEDRDKKFVTMKVNYSPENENSQFLSLFPKIQGYPHIFVLESDGRLIHSQDTAKLERGKGYDTEAFTAFLQRWSPPGPSSPAGR